MNIRLKPISEQVMVITGASSGIGLVTAKLAARRGARVVLSARNARDLDHAVSDIRRDAGRAVSVPADVTDAGQVDGIAEAAIEHFGRIDTWVNNAAVAVYGRLVDVPVADMRRQFDVLYWGQVHGSLTAVKHLRQAGGALVNVASALADRAIPLQGTYCAAKHAIKAFTDTLRVELEAAGVPVSVTLVKPASIDTPLFDKARTYLDAVPQPIAPVYAPDIVAQTILHVAQRPVRDVIVGGAGLRLSLAQTLAPRLADRYMERTFFDEQQRVGHAPERPDNLYVPVDDDGGERGRNWTGRVRGTSAYTHVALHPRAWLAGVGLGAVLAAAPALKWLRRR